MVLNPAEPMSHAGFFFFLSCARFPLIIILAAIRSVNILMPKQRANKQINPVFGFYIQLV